MTTPTIELIKGHASVRHYKQDSVPPEIVEIIAAAGQHASTSSNLQTYSVVAITEADKRHRLADLCGHQQFIAEAPLFLIWCADLARLDHVCRIKDYIQDASYLESFLVATIDTALAAQNCALAAESLGLGICYIGSIRNNPQEVIDLFGLPRLTFPIMGMTVGWPSKLPHLRPRLALNTVLHWGHYENLNEEAAFAEYDKAMSATGIYKGRQVPFPGKPDQIENYSWMEHSARRVSRSVRTGLREFIIRQGFGLL
jgi:FMN reductase (NADPH)